MQAGYGVPCGGRERRGVGTGRGDDNVHMMRICCLKASGQKFSICQGMSGAPAVPVSSTLFMPNNDVMNESGNYMRGKAD